MLAPGMHRLGFSTMSLLPPPLSPMHAYLRQRIGSHLRDRARAHSFGRFLWRRFLDDRLFEAAGALSFTTVFALVPLSMVAFGVLRAIPGFGALSTELSTYIFSNFVPTAARNVETYLLMFFNNAGGLTAASAIALVISLLITLTSVETTFNRIWRVKTARPKFSRFLVYWTVLTLGVLVAAASMALSTRLFALAIFQTQPGLWLVSLLVRVAPAFIELVAFAAIYRVVPHRTVHWRHAFAGALLAIVMFELIRWGMGAFMAKSFAAYEKIYGAVASVPIFLLWVFLSWVSVLLGASLAASISAFRYQPAALRLPEGYELYGLLRMLGRFAQARKTGQGLNSNDILKAEPMLTDDLVQQMLAQMCQIALLKRGEDGAWLLARDLDEMTLAELYEACQLRIPVAEAYLPAREDALGVAAIATIDELRVPLRELLKRKVGSMYEEVGP